MSKINWDSTGSRFYETGVDRGVLYDSNGLATPWNGLTSLVENTSSMTETVNFIDGYRYMNKISLDTYSATLSAFTYPDVFSEYVGESYFGDRFSKPRYFNLSYRTMVGNDINGIDNGYKLHLVYNAIAKPSTSDYISYGSQVTPTVFSWDIETNPVDIQGLKPSSHIILDSNKVNQSTLLLIEDILYGTDSEDARFITIEELLSIFDENSYFRIIDHGDGSFSAIGDDEYVSLVEDTVFELNSPSVVITSDDSYRATSL
jgi:hypothetical protein